MDESNQLKPLYDFAIEHLRWPTQKEINQLWAKQIFPEGLPDGFMTDTTISDLFESIEVLRAFAIDQLRWPTVREINQLSSSKAKGWRTYRWYCKHLGARDTWSEQIFSEGLPKGFRADATGDGFEVLRIFAIEHLRWPTQEEINQLSSNKAQGWKSYIWYCKHLGARDTWSEQIFSEGLPKGFRADATNDGFFESVEVLRAFAIDQLRWPTVREINQLSSSKAKGWRTHAWYFRHLGARDTWSEQVFPDGLPEGFKN